MVSLHSLDYLFAIGTMFAFLDTWNIGANDVANSFATSVSSRSLTYLQAMGIASVMEFSGSMGVGARVAETIRTKIVNVKLFADNPALLMLGMVCAIVASSIYLTIATSLGMPVSTTHSIMGGVIGMGIAALGSKGILWWGGNINSGVTQVFLAWIFAPLIAAGFGAIIFTITKYSVMLRSNPVMNAFFAIPIYFGITSALLTMLIVWKGGASRISLTEPQTIGVIIGVGAVVALLVSFFFLPYLYCKVVKNDASLKSYHILMGPFILRRNIPQGGEDVQVVQDYYRNHQTMEELVASRNTAAEPGQIVDPEKQAGLPPHQTSDAVESPAKDGTHTPVKNGVPSPATGGVDSPVTDVAPKDTHHHELGEHASIIGPRPSGKFLTPPVLFWQFKRFFFRGVDKDIVSLQGKRNILTGDLELMHAHAAHYNNKVEYMYSFLQVMTAATASFTHGANDVSNAVGPYTTIYYIWSTNKLNSSNPVPYWILAFGGAAIIIGLWTYGYNIMRNLGNRITLHSPSRGFSMELGSALTVILATRLKLPISTTQCISGATVGVGLCSGTWRTINWRMVAWIYFGWMITLPCAGIIAGCLMGIIINAPRWGFKISS